MTAEKARLPNMKGLVGRVTWNARAPKFVTPLNPREVRGLSFHYTGMNADEQADHRNCPARVQAVQNYHMDTQKWNDGAYNFVVCKHGSIFVMRGWWARSAANGTNAANDAYIAVCFLGDDTAGRDDVTRAGRAALARIIDRFEHHYGKRPVLRPHSAFRQTACPGNEIRRFIAARKGGR